MDPLLSRLQPIFRDVFDDESIVLDPTFSQDSYPDWDSFAQVKLVIAISEELEIQFSTDQVLSAKSVDDWLRLIRTVRPE